MTVKHFVLIGKKKYDYELQPTRKFTLLVVRELGIEERVPNEDLPKILLKLHELIRQAKEEDDSQKQSEVMRFRVSPDEKQEIERLAYENGFESVSAYIRAVAVGRFKV